jgi:hypothetical protein
VTTLDIDRGSYVEPLIAADTRGAVKSIILIQARQASYYTSKSFPLSFEGRFKTIHFMFCGKEISVCRASYCDDIFQNVIERFKIRLVVVDSLCEQPILINFY